MKFWITAARLIVTICLLGLLLTRVDIQQVAAILTRIMPAAFIASVLVLAAINPLLAIRWRMILKAGGFPARYSTLVKFLFIGWFFNQLLPTGIGGDAVRAWRCRKLGMDLGAAIRGVLIDRAWGYGVVILLCASGLPSLLDVIHDPLQQWSLIVVLAIATCGLIAALVMDRLPAPLVRLRVVAPFAVLSRQARSLLLRPGSAIPILFLSTIGLLLTILSTKLVGDSLDVHLSYGTWLVVLPPVLVIQLLPVSLGGWGVREMALVLLLSAFGISQEAGLAVSLLVGIGQIVVGLPGGLLWLTDLDLPDTSKEVKAVASEEAAESDTRLHITSGKHAV